MNRTKAPQCVLSTTRGIGAPNNALCEPKVHGMPGSQHRCLPTRYGPTDQGSFAVSWLDQRGTMCSSVQTGFYRDFLGPDIGVPMILRAPILVSSISGTGTSKRRHPRGSVFRWTLGSSANFCAYLCFTISLVLTEVTINKSHK